MYWQCGTCHALVMDQYFHPSPAAEKARYEEHNNDVDDPAYQQFTAPITEFVLAHYQPHHTGLDYGAGTGPVITKVLSDAGYAIVPYDPFFHPDKRLLQQVYDFIVACEVVEHFFDPAMEFLQLKKRLKPGGRLLIMTYLYKDAIDFRHWHYRNDPTHVCIYRKETFQYIASAFEMNLERINHRLVVLQKPVES